MVVLGVLQEKMVTAVGEALEDKEGLLILGLKLITLIAMITKETDILILITEVILIQEEWMAQME